LWIFAITFSKKLCYNYNIIRFSRGDVWCLRSVRSWFTAAESLIAAMPLSVMEWQDNAKLRAECFRRILERGEREELISLMRTVYLKKQELAEVGRRIYAADENAMKRAERMIFDELSVVLGVGDDEIIKMIDEKVKTA